MVCVPGIHFLWKFEGLRPYSELLLKELWYASPEFPLADAKNEDPTLINAVRRKHPPDPLESVQRRDPVAVPGMRLLYETDTGRKPITVAGLVNGPSQDRLWRPSIG